MEFPSQMLRLTNQEEFEALLKSTSPARYVCILFSASWCGPCKKLDKKALIDAHQDVVWYGCDVDENNYTLGYCGLKKIPSFAFIKHGKFMDTLSGTIDVGVISSWVDKMKGV